MICGGEATAHKSPSGEVVKTGVRSCKMVPAKVRRACEGDASPAKVRRLRRRRLPAKMMRAAEGDASPAKMRRAAEMEPSTAVKPAAAVKPTSSVKPTSAKPTSARPRPRRHVEGEA